MKVVLRADVANVGKRMLVVIGARSQWLLMSNVLMQQRFPSLARLVLTLRSALTYFDDRECEALHDVESLLPSRKPGHQPRRAARRQKREARQRYRRQE